MSIFIMIQNVLQAADSMKTKDYLPLEEETKMIEETLLNSKEKEH